MNDDDLIVGRRGARFRASDYPEGFAERLTAALIASQLKATAPVEGEGSTGD